MVAPQPLFILHVIVVIVLVRLQAGPEASKVLLVVHQFCKVFRERGNRGEIEFSCSLPLTEIDLSEIAKLS